MNLNSQMIDYYLRWSERMDDGTVNHYAAGLYDLRTARALHKTLKAQPNVFDLKLNKSTASAFARIRLTIGKDGELYAITPDGGTAAITNFAFGQLCKRAGAPTDYLRDLPAELAAQNLEHGLKRNDVEEASLLFYQNGSTHLRAANHAAYARVWNADVLEHLIDLMNADGANWRVPPARAVEGRRSRFATEADVLKVASHSTLGVKVGDSISPAGLYKGDRNMFMFFVDDSKRIDVNGASLCRGFFAWNTEVGELSIGMILFLFDSICGNHLVWGAREVRELRMPHFGHVNTRWFTEAQAELTKYANESSAEDVARITASQRLLLAPTKTEVITSLFKGQAIGLPRKTIEAAYAIAETTPRYGDPRSVWGMVNGLTEISQATTYTEERVRIDRAAGKLLDRVS